MRAEVNAVIYLVAIIALAAIAVLSWKAFGPRAPAHPRAFPKGPDDDPEFLWQIRQQPPRAGKADDEPS